MGLADLVKRIADLFSPRQITTGGETETVALVLDQVLSVSRALAHSAVWKAVRLISADVAKIPIDLYRFSDSGREKVREHPAIELLRFRAAPGVSGVTFRRVLTAHALLTGNGFAWIRRSGTKPVQLVILDPLQTRLANDTAALVWETVVDGQTQRILDDDVLHIKGTCWDGLTGMNPLQVLSRCIGLELAVQDFAYGFFKKGFALSGFLQCDRTLSPEEVNRLRQDFKKGYQGESGAYELGILHGGLKYEPLVQDPEKTQLVEARDAGLRSIANIFGIPPHKLGDPTRTSYASIEAENADYLASCLDPWLVEWEAELNMKLLSRKEAGSMYFEHNRNAIVRTEFASRVEGYAKLVGIGVLSPNEVRQRENLNSRPNGDSYYVPANWMREPSSGNQEPAETAVQGTGD